MATFYTGVDKERYDAGNKYVPMDQFLLDYKTPTTNTEEEVTTSYGIPNTNAFTNSGGGGGGGGGPFDPYTANLDYLSNRTNYGRSGYLPGEEPEENYMQKIGGMIKTGIGMAIPGGNALMGMMGNMDKFSGLNANDKAFIEMQMANQEQSMHGGNLTNQDRYGYNKRSMLGNYGDLVKERVEIAKGFIDFNHPDADEDGFYRDIDKYYNEKAKEQGGIDKQIAANDWQRQRITANKLREQEALDISPYPTGQNIHGGDDTPTGAATTIAPRHHADHSTGQGQGDYQAPNIRSAKEAMDKGIDVGAGGMMGPGGKHYAIGGRVYLNLGGLAGLL